MKDQVQIQIQNSITGRWKKITIKKYYRVVDPLANVKRKKMARRPFGIVECGWPPAI